MLDQLATVLAQVEAQFDVWLHKQIFDNEFLIAGVATVALGGATYLLRNVPGTIWRLALRAFTLEVTINNDTVSFVHIMKFINNHRIGWLQRTFLVGQDNYDVRDAAWMVGPGYGFSAFLFEGRPVVAMLQQMESHTKQAKMAFTLRFTGRSPARVQRFVDTVKEAAKANRHGIDIFALRLGGDWSLIASDKPRRGIETVFLPATVKTTVMGRLTEFYASEAAYRKRGLPWKTGLLLTGPPGTGKTSLIHAIASHFDKNIRFLNLGAMFEGSLGDMLCDLSSRDILVIEDIDTYSVAGKRPGARRKNRNPGIADDDDEDEINEGEPEISLSTLLNVLDGLLSPDGVVAIATTNHPEALDPALVRKGRFDLTVDLGPLDGETMTEMFAAFYGEDRRSEAEAFIASGVYVPVVGAVAQDLFRHETPGDALARLAAPVEIDAADEIPLHVIGGQRRNSRDAPVPRPATRY